MTLIFLGVVAGTLLLDLYLLPYWLVVYYLALAAEKTLLWHWKEARSRGFFHLIVAVSTLIGAIYAALPVYFWLMPDGTLQFVGMIVLLGGIVNGFLVRARLWQIAAAHMAPLGVATLVIAATHYRLPAGGAEFYFLILVSLAAIIYTMAAIHTANASYRRHLDTRAQFFQAQKMEAMGRLSGGIAHDFNNVLSVVHGNLELMPEARNEDERELFRTEAQEACWRAAALTRQLLALGRSSAGTPMRIDPAAALESVERLVRRLLPENIGFELDAPEGPLEVLTDETTLQTALLNLAINARDAMPDGGRMGFSARMVRAGERGLPEALPEGDYVALTVWDTGEGIDRDHLRKIFDPFFTTKPKGRGTGLGLAMVEGFARKSGGAVVARSRVGEGSSFTIYLPALAPDETRLATSLAARVPTRIAAKAAGRIRAARQPAASASAPLRPMR